MSVIPEQERRKFKRLPVNGIASFSYKNEIFNGILLDISLKGALVQLAKGCHLEEEALGTTPSTTLGGTITNPKEVKFNFSLNNNAIRIFFTGSIVHVQDNNIGIRCHSININSASHLKRLIELNLGEPLLLAKELNAYIIPNAS